MNNNMQEVIDALFNDANKAKVLKALNDSIDIPIISEKTEGKILESIWNIIEDVLKRAVLKG
tara:strand:+ start:914 stop:1099 length:186 start_codon:yes stop_codon:yes gene_type:complete